MIPRRVRFHPYARAEAVAAARWYEDREPGLGGDFVAEVQRAVGQIAEAPARWGRSPHDPRAQRLLLSRFPYAVVYVVGASGEVTIAAVAHTRRRPGYWHDRLR